MDGVLCDFYSAAKTALTENPAQKFPQSKWGFFLKLKPIADAIESIRVLQKEHDVWILTRPSFYNVNCYTEKAQWILDHFDLDLLKKTIFSGDKSLLLGDVLIDDQNNARQSEFNGKWIQFGSIEYPDWKTTVAAIEHLKMTLNE